MVYRYRMTTIVEAWEAREQNFVLMSSPTSIYNLITRQEAEWLQLNEPTLTAEDLEALPASIAWELYSDLATCGPNMREVNEFFQLTMAKAVSDELTDFSEWLFKLHLKNGEQPESFYLSQSRLPSIARASKALTKKVNQVSERALGMSIWTNKENFRRAFSFAVFCIAFNGVDIGEAKPTMESRMQEGYKGIQDYLTDNQK